MKPVLLSLSLAFMVACGGTQRPPDDEVTEPTVLLDAMATRLDGVESLRADSAIEYYGEEGRVRVTQAMVVRLPGDLRIETISPFDTTLNLLVANDEDLVFLDMEGNTMYVGEPTAEDIGRLLPIPLSPADLVRVILGGAPVDAIAADTSTYAMTWDRREGAYRLELPIEGGGELVLFVAHETWQVDGGEGYDPAGQRVYRFTTSSRRLEGGLPSAIRFVLDGDGTDVSLDIESVTLNPTLPDILFELRPAPGVHVEQL